MLQIFSNYKIYFISFGEKVVNFLSYCAQIVKTIIIWIHSCLLQIFQNCTNIIFYIFDYCKEFFNDFKPKKEENLFSKNLSIKKEEKKEEVFLTRNLILLSPRI
ncbi:unnamed protein product [Meloidogyne enterolobii]|uniref:Uncharacterized protein n=1 Tax=Meloidogyne enterolobii TaxID=390850 RepID=A0ACB0YBD9_MELEN